MRSVSFQKDRAPLRTSRSACPQLAELLQLSVEEVCADFDAMLRHDWRRLGISAKEVQEFCVWRNAPARAKLRSGHRTVCLLAFRQALLHVLGRGAAGGARALPGARQTLPPIQEWRRFNAADVQPQGFACPGLVYT